MGVWSRARRLPAKTPPERNRYVDFLRAVSILCVIFGHWLIATGHYTDVAAFSLVLIGAALSELLPGRRGSADS